MNSMLSPDYIVGFVDGEGCFCITLNRKRNETPEVRLIFEIEVRFDDELTPGLMRLDEAQGGSEVRTETYTEVR